MDYEIIENEVDGFSALFFEDIADAAEENDHFIDDNSLPVPREDYTILNKFLQKTLANFKILDPTYCSSTLNKLGTDLKQLSEIYDKLLKKTKDTKSIFESQFIPHSPTLTSFAKAILDLAELPNKTPEDALYLKKLKTDYIKLKEIFYEIFEEVFINDKKRYLLALKSGMNTKSYYFDKLLWKEADASMTIVKHFSIRKLDGKLNTKDYILFTTAIMRPYTDEYRYLQTCLKVFK